MITYIPFELRSKSNIFGEHACMYVHVHVSVLLAHEHFHNEAEARDEAVFY